MRNDTYSTRLQTDSSRIKSDTFPDKREGLGGWVLSAFVMTTCMNGGVLVRSIRKRNGRMMYISRNLAGSEVPWVTDKNVRYG